MIDPNAGLPSSPGGNSYRAPGFTLTMSADQQTIFANFIYDLTWRQLDFIPTIRIWYIDGTLVSKDQIATPTGFLSAQQNQSKLITSFLVSGRSYQIAFNINLSPLFFSHGGWLWVDSVGDLDSTYFPTTGAVPIPTRNLYTAAPAYQVAGANVGITPVTINGVNYKKLLFGWMNPNPLDTFYYLLIVMYNYRNLGLYEELARFTTVQVYGSLSTASNVARGSNNGVGPIYLVSDFDGAHNVTLYHVVENISCQHAPNYPSVALAYSVIGGV